MLQGYQARLGKGDIRADAAQAAVAERLDGLARTLKSYRAGARRGLFSRKPATPPRGIYLWGDVGRGKTMLMDLFFAHAHPAAKRRVHFNAFMQDVHGRIHAARQREQAPDVIAPVARALAGEFSLLCLDEFQVEDITDAMMLGRLFEALLAAGVVIVVTSNTRPAELYRDGLNRQLFLPFISLIEQRFDVVGLNAATDYRLGRMGGRRVYVSPLGPAATREIDALWQDLTDGEAGTPLTLKLKGRELLVPRAAHGAARFRFAELCEIPTGTADYLALAERFGTVFLTDVPKLGPARRNEARRFTLLVDTLYDRGRKLVISAAAAPEALGIAPRTRSRLAEMASAGWWEGTLPKKSGKS